MKESSWLHITRGDAPLIVSLPHTGTDLAGLEASLVSPWLARKDTDWWIDRLYAFAADLGVTIVRTSISRTVIDVNRDPSGASLYPGQATTSLCPTTTFDGEALYKAGEEPAKDAIAERCQAYFDPYHAALRAEIERLRARHGLVVLYDCHSIRSVIPRLFEGALPIFNLGANDGKSAWPSLVQAIEAIMRRSGESHVTDGRFKGGWITRANGAPERGVHAVQMELACRSYLGEPETITPENWPPPYDVDRAAPMREKLADILRAIFLWSANPPAE